MPIPTRTRSTSVKTTSGIPSRKPSTREALKEVVSQTTTTENTQDTIDADVAAPNSRLIRDSRTRTASQIRPPIQSVRHVSTAVLPTSSTRTIPRRAQPSCGSTERNVNQIRQRHEAATTSGQMPSITTRSLPTGKGQQDGTQISSRPSRARQAPTVLTQSTRPRNATSLVSDSSVASASSRTVENSILQSQRDELLQLGITHLNSQQVLDAYERHVQEEILQRTEKLAVQEADLLRLERQKQGVINSRALQLWLDHDPESTDVRQVQTLSTAIRRLNSHDFNLKYAEILQMFQQWLDKAVNVRETRLGRIQPDELQFLPSLGHLWHRQASEIEQSLSIIVTTLEDGKPKLENSGIAVITTQNQRLAKVMLQEIQTAVMMEKTVVLAESDWEQEQINTAINQLSLIPMNAGIGLWAS